MPPPDLFGQAKDIKREFLDEYIAGSKPLIEFYRNVRMKAVATKKVTVFPSGKIFATERAFVYKAMDPYFLSEETYLESDSESERGSTFVVGVNPRRSFKLAMRPKSDQYLILELGRNFSESVRHSAPFAFAPYDYSPFHESLPDVLASPAMDILKRDDKVVGGERLVRIEYRHKPGKWDLSGWLVFSPDNSWALIEQGRVSQASTFRRSISYKKRPGQVPLLEGIVEVLTDSSGALEERWSITELTPGPIPEEEFTLGFYGLAEQRERRTNVFRILVFGAFALLGLTAFLRYLWRRRSAPVAMLLLGVSAAMMGSVGCNRTVSVKDQSEQHVLPG